MKITAKTVLIILLVILNIWLWFGVLREKENPTPPTTDIEEIIQPEKQKIDSLTQEIEEREIIIGRLRDSLEKIEVIRIYEVDSIRKLPTTEGVEFLRTKLREFESKYQEE